MRSIHGPKLHGVLRRELHLREQQGLGLLHLILPAILQQPTTCRRPRRAQHCVQRMNGLLAVAVHPVLHRPARKDSGKCLKLSAVVKREPRLMRVSVKNTPTTVCMASSSPSGANFLTRRTRCLLCGSYALRRTYPQQSRCLHRLDGGIRVLVLTDQ